MESTGNTEACTDTVVNCQILEVMRLESIQDGGLKISPGVILQIRFNPKHFVVGFLLPSWAQRLPCPKHTWFYYDLFSITKGGKLPLSFLFFLASFHNSFSTVPIYLHFYLFSSYITIICSLFILYLQLQQSLVLLHIRLFCFTYFLFYFPFPGFLK